MNGAEKPYFELSDNSAFPIHPELSKLSPVIADKLKKGQPIKLSEQYIAEKFNQFAEVFFQKYAEELKNLEHASDKDDWWMELVAENKDLSDVCRGLYQDDLIRVGNAASELNFPGLVHACAYVMAELTENMKLAELREYLNEDYDFPDEVKAKIEACPEFAEL